MVVRLPLRNDFPDSLAALHLCDSFVSTTFMCLLWRHYIHVDLFAILFFMRLLWHHYVPVQVTSLAVLDRVTALVALHLCESFGSTELSDSLGATTFLQNLNNVISIM